MKSIRPALVVAFFIWSLAVGFAVNSSAQAATVSSSTHPALVTHGFASANPFVAYKREGGVASGARFEIEDGALNITNAYAGSFGIDTKTPAFDAEKYGHLFFDYLLPPAKEVSKTVKVNIFLRVKGSYHGVSFTGPEQVRPGSVYLGALSKVQADGKWHRIHIPIRDWLRKLYPRDDQLQVEEVVIGNWDNAGFLMAGIGGNGEGATWKLDNFTIAGAGPGEAKFELQAGAGKTLAAPSEYSWSLDGGAATALTGLAWNVKASNGFHTLQVFDKAKKPIAEYGFFVAGGAPQVGQPSLQNGIVQIPIETSAGLDLTQLKLAVDDKTFETDSPYLRWDGKDGVLQLDAARAGLIWKDGQSIALTLTGVQDRVNPPAPKWTSSLKMEFAAQKAPPPLPELAELKSLGSGSFEESLDEWTTREGEGGAIVERDPTTSASGHSSVRLTSPTNSSVMAAWIRRTAFDAVRFPVIEFDYKLERDVRVDFQLVVDGKTYSVGFTDQTPQYQRIGQIPDVKADEEWHHARIDLLAWLRQARPTASTHMVQSLAIADSGYLGNARGVQMWIDNFQLMPVVKGAPFRSSVQLPDVTGIKALSWIVDEQVNTVPPAAAKETGDALQLSGAGARWLHLRAQNGAGQWSQTAHVPLALDAAPPVVGEVSPTRGAKSALPQFTIKLSDDAGLDPSSIALTVQGTQYLLREEGLDFSDRTGVLSLDLSNLVRRGRLNPLADGTKISWKLAAVRDAAGQSAPETSGEWTYDYASDKIPPTLDVVAASPSLLIRRNFEDGTGDVTVANGKAEIAQRPELNGGTPNRALRLVPSAVGQPLTVNLVNRGFNPRVHNLLGFHYKIPSRAKLALRVRSGGEMWLVKMAGDVPKPATEIKGIVADDTWRWAQFDFKELAEQLKNKNVTALELIDVAGQTPTDLAIEIDNVLVQTSQAGPIKLSWKGSDLSGVTKYRFAWDQNPGTVPTEETDETARSIEAKTGLWWAHVQVGDSAGNLSPVVHLPILVP